MNVTWLAVSDAEAQRGPTAGLHPPIPATELRRLILSGEVAARWPDGEPIERLAFMDAKLLPDWRVTFSTRDDAGAFLWSDPRAFEVAAEHFERAAAALVPRPIGPARDSTVLERIEARLAAAAVKPEPTAPTLAETRDEAERFTKYAVAEGAVGFDRQLKAKEVIAELFPALTPKIAAEIVRKRVAQHLGGRSKGVSISQDETIRGARELLDSFRAKSLNSGEKKLSAKLSEKGSCVP